MILGEIAQSLAILLPGITEHDILQRSPVASFQFVIPDRADMIPVNIEEDWLAAVGGNCSEYHFSNHTITLYVHPVPPFQRSVSATSAGADVISVSDITPRTRFEPTVAA